MRPSWAAMRHKLKDLLDAEVEVTGAVAGKFDSKMQLAGILLEVPSASDVHDPQTRVSPDRSTPHHTHGQILGVLDVQDHTQRVQVSGTITYYQPAPRWPSRRQPKASGSTHCSRNL